MIREGLVQAGAKGALYERAKAFETRMSSTCNNETVKRLIHCHVYEGTRICSFIALQHHCSTANKVGSAKGSEGIVQGLLRLWGFWRIGLSARFAPQLDHSLHCISSTRLKKPDPLGVFYCIGMTSYSRYWPVARRAMDRPMSRALTALPLSARYG